MKILQNNIIQSNPYKNLRIKSSKNPLKLYNAMKIYSKERNEKAPFYKAFINSINTILNNCKMRYINNENGDLSAAYTYKLRKNSLGKKSMYIDILVRDKTNNQSKTAINKIYSDIKQIANKNKVKELTLFVNLNDSGLIKKYEELGFHKDEKLFIHGGYIMRANPEKFLSNLAL